MQETLFDRFRPFRPYDLVLGLLMLVMVTLSSSLPPLPGAFLVAGGSIIYCVLYYLQRFVRVPTPTWLSLSIVALNTLAIAVLIFLQGVPRHSLALAILNTAFATVAFGQHSGIVASVLSVALLSSIKQEHARQQLSGFEWALFLAIQFTLVSILTRISQLHHDALFDVVTRLRNHRYFQVRLREELDRSKRYGRPTALLLVDMDNFKRVNDQFGHSMGDQVLRDVAQVLVQNSRAVDIVCRYGGEELAVILPETPLTDAALVADRLRKAVEQRRDERGISITLSAGVAVCPDHGIEADALIAAADAAMYRAKRQGKNQVVSAETWLGNGDLAKGQVKE